MTADTPAAPASAALPLHSEELLRDADVAMYSAKKQGRDCVVWADAPAQAHQT